MAEKSASILWSMSAFFSDEDALLFGGECRFLLQNPGLWDCYKMPFSVIPAKAGIHNNNKINLLWIPVFAGITLFIYFATVPL